MPFEPIPMELNTASREEWCEIMRAKLKGASRFELHCWNEEAREIELALQYGERTETDWAYGKVIAGPVTQAFVDALLAFPKPEDTEIYNKMTPFFSIFLDNGFSSEHYGTELNQQEMTAL